MERNIAFGSRDFLNQESRNTGIQRLDKRYVDKQINPCERGRRMICGLDSHFRRRRGMKASLLVGFGLGLSGFVLAASATRLMVRVDFAGLRLVFFATRAGVLVRAEVPAATVYVRDRLHRQEQGHQDNHQGLHIAYSNEIQAHSKGSLHVSQGPGLRMRGHRRGPVEGAPPVVLGSVHLRHMLQSPAFSPHIIRSPLCSQKLRRSVCFPTVTNM